MNNRPTIATDPSGLLQELRDFALEPGIVKFDGNRIQQGRNFADALAEIRDGKKLRAVDIRNLFLDLQVDIDRFSGPGFEGKNVQGTLNQLELIEAAAAQLKKGNKGLLSIREMVRLKMDPIGSAPSGGGFSPFALTARLVDGYVRDLGSGNYLTREIARKELIRMAPYGMAYLKDVRDGTARLKGFGLTELAPGLPLVLPVFHEMDREVEKRIDGVLDAEKFVDSTAAMLKMVFASSAKSTVQRLIASMEKHGTRPIGIDQNKMPLAYPKAMIDLLPMLKKLDAGGPEPTRGGPSDF